MSEFIHCFSFKSNLVPRPLQSIDPGQQFTWENSNLEVNKPKNRYANVIAYDHSRVILSSIEGKTLCQRVSVCYAFCLYISEEMLIRSSMSRTFVHFLSS